MTKHRTKRVKLNDILQETNFSLQFVKRGKGPRGEGSEFRVIGEIVTEADRLKAFKFIADAIRDPDLVRYARFIDSRDNPKITPFDSASRLDDELDKLLQPSEDDE